MKTLQIVLLILIIIGLGLLFTQKFWVDDLVNFILKQEQDKKTVLAKDPLNISFTISGREYTLVNGKVEMAVAPGSASKEIIRVFDEPVFGDLSGDGVKDAVMFLTQDSGGSGTFFYVVEAINYNGEYKGTNAMLLGDRIAPQNINIQDGRAVANFAERKAGEPMTAKPSVGKSVWVYYNQKTGEIGEWVKNFEGDGNRFVEPDFSNLIKVQKPTPGQLITSPFVVEGTARGQWYFEATFPIVLVDWDGRIIAQSYGQAEGEWMTESFVPFKGTINFKSPYKQGDPDFMKRGAIILQKSNPSDLPQNDAAIEIPITFQ